MNLFQESLKIRVNDWFSGIEYWFDGCKTPPGLVGSSAADGLDVMMCRRTESVITSNLLDVSGNEMTIRSH